MSLYDQEISCPNCDYIYSGHDLMTRSKKKDTELKCEGCEKPLRILRKVTYELERIKQ